MCDLPDPSLDIHSRVDTLIAPDLFQSCCKENCIGNSSTKLSPAVMLAVATRGIHIAWEELQKTFIS